MMRAAIAMLAALAAATAVAITATKDYVDRKDAEHAVAATNLVIVATNDLARLVGNKADEVKVVTALGETSTNTVVRSSTPLLIRAHTDPDGVKRYRLIDLEP